MSGGGAGGGRGNVGGRATAATASAAAASVSGAIPAGSRKIVQNIREIVNYPEAEIYSMLKECNMDPSEAVNRLLNQDTFQEVKSKRDKKKETKDAPESKARGANNTSIRGRSSNDRTRVVSNSSTSYDYVSRNKPILKKENVPNAVPGSSILGSAISGYSTNKTSYSPSVVASADVSSYASVTDCIPVSSKPSTGFQHAWSGVPGQVSMADIVRMGKPQPKISNKSSGANDVSSMVRDHVPLDDFEVDAKHPPTSLWPSEPTQDWPSFHDNAPKISDAIYDSNTLVIDGHISHDEPFNQLHSENRSTMLVTSNNTAMSVEPAQSSGLHDDGFNLYIDSRMDENHIENPSDSLIMGSMRPEASHDGQVEVSDTNGRLCLVDAPSGNSNPYEPQKNTFEQHEVEDEDFSTVTTNFEQLNLQQEVSSKNHPDDRPTVIFPEHLQVTNADCSHLSFGSFGSAISGSYSGSHGQKTLPSNLEQPSTTSDISSFERVDARNNEFYNNDQIKSPPEEIVACRDSTAMEHYEQSSASQLTHTETDASRPENKNQYNMPSLMPGHHGFPIISQPAADPNYVDTRSQGQDLATISSMVQAYVNSLHSNVLSPANQPGRELDPSYLSMLSSQAVPTKYNPVISSMNDPTISMQETMKSSYFSGAQIQQPTPQASESTSTLTGPGLPQHLSVHPYNQPTLPVGHFATNMISYPFLHPSYAYMPSGFQPTYTGNSAYHQSPTATQSAGVKYTLPPQYKNTLSINNLPQSATIPSGYGGFGSSANIPGNFMLNPSAAQANTSTNFEDVLGPQYKDGNPYALLQQGSRTMSALPSNAYYGLQGQSQHSGFRQAQQPQQPSNYGNLGYANLYRSQVGSPQESQQNPSEVANMSNPQGLQSQPSHHLWQRNY